MTVRALPLLLVALLTAPVPVAVAQPPQTEPFTIGFTGDGDIFTVDSNGNARTNLTNNPREQHDPAFSLDGTNLRVTVPVTFAEAALGATIAVPTLDGSTVKVKVPAGTPSGRTLRVKGRGVRTAKGTGDLLVTVQVAVPQKLSRAAREAVETFAAETDGEDVRADLVRQAAE